MDLVACKLGHPEGDLAPGPIRQHHRLQLFSLACYCRCQERRHSNGSGRFLLTLHPAGNRLTGIDTGREHRFITLIVEVRAHKAAAEEQIHRNRQFSVDHHLQTALTGVGFALHRADPMAGPVCQFQAVGRAGHLKVHQHIAGSGQDQPGRRLFTPQTVSQNSQLLRERCAVQHIQEAGHAGQDHTVVD